MQQPAPDYRFLSEQVDASTAGALLQLRRGSGATAAVACCCSPICEQQCPWLVPAADDATKDHLAAWSGRMCRCRWLAVRLIVI
jgi:hypothetical protein